MEYAGRTVFVGEFLGLEVDPLPAVLIFVGSAVVFLAAAPVVVSVKVYTGEEATGMAPSSGEAPPSNNRRT